MTMNVLSKLGLLMVLGSAACVSAGQHKAAVADDSADKLTVGKVQKEIRVGMSGADVVQVLGSPNIVTTDEKSREVWVYDKLSTETAYSSTQGGATILVLGVGGSAGATSRTQKTLTVVIKFGDDKKVRDFSYHASSF
jgi:outer membrane protein assembly factor BamE (lipoprotein component of BamABCDE complex)